jgi:sRNA-binding protein
MASLIRETTLMPTSNPRQSYQVIAFASRRDKPPPRQQPQAPAPVPKPPPALTGKRKRAADAAAWLKATWPALFNHPPKPLAIGIGAAIMAHARAAGHAPYAVGTFLHRWTHSPRYLHAIAAKGAVRWGLSGTAVDFVASEHQAGARLKLAELAAAKAAKRKPAP